MLFCPGFIRSCRWFVAVAVVLIIVAVESLSTAFLRELSARRLFIATHLPSQPKPAAASDGAVRVAWSGSGAAAAAAAICPPPAVVGNSPRVPPQFDAWLSRESIASLRLVCLVLTVTSALFGLQDYLLLGPADVDGHDKLSFVLQARFCWMVPTLAAFTLLTLTACVQNNLQAMTALFLTAACAANVAQYAVLSYSANSDHYASVGTLGRCNWLL